MKNEYVILYAIVDFYARHLVSSEIIDIKDGNIKVLVNRNKLSKVDRKIFDDFFKILAFLGRLSDIAYENIKKKWENILKGFREYKGIENGYAAVLVGLVLLDYYSKLKNKKLQIHPNRIKKIMELLQKEAKLEWADNFKFLDKTILKSIEFAEKIKNQIGA